jgi:molybdopterin synthase catalytic subunit
MMRRGLRGSRKACLEYDARVLAPIDGDDWLGLTADGLPIGDLYEWCVRPDCGAVVLFSGTVRDHAEGRAGVEFLEYEAYDEMVVPKLAEIAAETRARWPDVGRIALVHRVGRLALGESSVVAAVSAPHRPDAFAAARFAIDALKASVPVWKREVWRDGSDWGTGAAVLVPASEVPSEESIGEGR